MPGSDDLLDQKPQGEPKRPRIIAIASWIWIIDGCLDLLYLLWLLTVGIKDTAIGKAPFSSPALLHLAAPAAVIGAAFLYVGVQTLRGKARDTRGNSSGSIVIGILPIVMCVSRGDYKIFGWALRGSAPLLVPGILAWLGRRQYLVWRAAINANRPVKEQP